MLKLMYITKEPEIAKIASDAGVDIIFVDMEVLGKAERQGGMDTVQSHHKPEDIGRIRDVIGDRSEILARTDPIHEYTEEQVEACIRYGADIMMLPMWRTASDLQRFVSAVHGRSKVMPLLENTDAQAHVSEALEVLGIDSMFIGLNDLHLSQKKTFMFELLTDGTVEDLISKIRPTGMPYGFGGIARPGTGMLPAECIIREHVRLGSSSVILSRSFCNTELIRDKKEIERIFQDGVREIREVEEECQNWSEDQFMENRERIRDGVARIVSAIKEKK